VSRTSCAARRSLGVFVLDALEPAERDAVAEHLRHCAACRRELERIAPLPGLLAGVQAADLHAHEPSRPPHRPGMGAALWIVLLLALAGGAQLGRPQPATVRAADPANRVRMAADIAPLPTGALLRLRISGVEPGERCTLLVRAADGRSEIASRWRATYAGAATLDTTTSIAAADLTELSVLAGDGRRLLHLPIDEETS
jgi:Putative zinc-finger